MSKRIRKNMIYCLLTLLVFTSFFSSIEPNVVHADELGLEAETAILVDAESGKILYQLRPDVAMPPASMTKMMTEYLVLEAIHNNQIAWDQETQITEFVYNISQKRNLSNVPLRRDLKYSVRELYEAMAIYSANGATIALAELIAGTETNFVKMMNDKGAELKLKDFKFVNSTGLNNRDLGGNHPKGTGAEEENLLSARATAKLAYHLINDYPEVLETAKIPTKIFRENTSDAIQMLNWNWMLPGMPGHLQPFSYEGMDGIKTGSTDLAGFCFTGTAERNGLRLISVVMRTNSKTARFAETRKLMDYGFSNFVNKELFPGSYQLEGQSIIPVEKGKEKEVEIATIAPLKSVIKRNEEQMYEPKYVLDQSLLTEDGALTAPIEKDQKVGYLTFDYKGEFDYGYITDSGIETAKVDLVTSSKIEKANWFVLTLRGIGGFFSDVWTSVSDTVKGWFS